MSTVNVLKYSALGLGLLVGLKNDFSLKSTAAKKEAEQTYQNKLKLVEEAKLEYAKLKAPKTVAVVPANSGASAAKEINWEDPKLDYAAVVLNAVDTLKN